MYVRSAPSPREFLACSGAGVSLVTPITEVG